MLHAQARFGAESAACILARCLFTARQAVCRPFRSVSRRLVPALDLIGAYQTTADDVRLVRQFALRAVELSRAELRGAPSVLALS